MISYDDLDKSDLKNHYDSSLGEAKPHWPKNVRTLSLAALDYLGFDGKHLYWDGKKLLVEKKIKLSFWQAVSGFIITISTLAIPIIEIYKILEDVK